MSALKIAPPINIPSPKLLKKSKTYVFKVVWLNPYFSSITNVLYKLNGKSMIKDPNERIPKNNKLCRILLAVKPLIQLSNEPKPLKTRIARITTRLIKLDRSAMSPLSFA